MAAHDFTRSIRFEHSGFDDQDEFYRKVLNAEDICRTDYDSGTGVAAEGCRCPADS